MKLGLICKEWDVQRKETVYMLLFIQHYIIVQEANLLFILSWLFPFVNIIDSEKL